MCWLIRGNNKQLMLATVPHSHVKWKRCLWLQSCNCKPFLTTFCAVCVLVTVCSGVLQLHWLMCLFTSYWGRSAESIFVWIVRLNFGSSLLKWITQYIERLFTYIDDLHLFQLPKQTETHWALSVGTSNRAGPPTAFKAAAPLCGICEFISCDPPENDPISTIPPEVF